MSKPDSGTAERTEEEVTRMLTGDDEDEKETKGKAAIEEDEEEPKREERRKEARGKDDEEPQPPPEHPRFNEIYGKMKAYERKLAERDSDFEQVRQHNRELSERLEQIERTKADRPAEPEPDPDIDPVAYRNWIKLQREKDKEEDRKQRMIDRHNLQVEMQRELHEDYDEVIKIAERELQKDKELSKKIWNSDNPAREAYKLGRQKKQEAEKEEKEETERRTTRDKMDVERSGEPGEAPETEEVKLDDQQKKVIRNLWPDLPFSEGRKKYIAQMKAMGRV